MGAHGSSDMPVWGRDYRVRAGEHTVVARAEGYTPVPLTVKILGGTVSAITIPMYTDAELTRETRKMPNWVPYTVLGGGVVLAAVGGLLHSSAKTSFDEYDQAISECASTDPSGGCSTLPAGVADKKTSAESNQTLAFTSYAIGGAAVVAGVVLVILNRPKTFRIDPTKGGAAELAISPTVHPTDSAAPRNPATTGASPPSRWPNSGTYMSTIVAAISRPRLA